GAHRGGGDLLGGAHHHRGGLALFPRAGRARPHPELGCHARRGTQLHHHGLVARPLPGDGNPHRGSRDQSHRRLAARRARSAGGARPVVRYPPPRLPISAPRGGPSCSTELFSPRRNSATTRRPSRTTPRLRRDSATTISSSTITCSAPTPRASLA